MGHMPAPAPLEAKVCQYWAREGRCPMKSCPYSCSHTAENSPRYAKFNQAQPVAVIETPVVLQRANALLIKDPSPPGTPPREKSPPRAVVEAPASIKKSRPNALEIVDV